MMGMEEESSVMGPEHMMPPPEPEKNPEGMCRIHTQVVFFMSTTTTTHALTLSSPIQDMLDPSATKDEAFDTEVIDKRSNYLVFTSKRHRAELAQENSKPLTAQQLSALWSGKSDQVCAHVCTVVYMDSVFLLNY